MYKHVVTIYNYINEYESTELIGYTDTIERAINLNLILEYFYKDLEKSDDKKYKVGYSPM